MQKKDKSARFEEETVSVIADNIVGPNRKYSSLAEFLERSVEQQSAQILPYVVDGDVLRKLIRHLNRIEGIEESKPRCATEARWGTESFGSPIEFTVSEEALGHVNQIKRHTGLDNSVIYRSCVFKQLFEIASQPSHPIGYEWKAEQIRRKWKDIASSLAAPQTQFHAILLRRFEINGEWTRDSLEHQTRQFNHFAEIYYGEFYGTDSYEQILEWCGDAVLQTVEDAIEEYTDVQID